VGNKVRQQVLRTERIVRLQEIADIDEGIVNRDDTDPTAISHCDAHGASSHARGAYSRSRNP